MRSQFSGNKIKIAQVNSKSNMILFIDIILEHQLSESGRKKSLFPIELWNVHDRSGTSLPRSNYPMESWHVALTRTDKIRREQTMFEVDIIRLQQVQGAKTSKNYIVFLTRQSNN
jgi:hypothetical protein